MHLISQYKGLPKQVYIICCARIITAMGAFIFSFTTLLMTGILGMSEIAAGYMSVASSITSLSGAVICGRLADRYDRKRVLLMIFAVNTVNLFIGGMVVFRRLVLANILIQSFCFSGFIPVLAAMISDVTVETNRKESFSLLFLCINIGYSMGQVIAGQLFYNYTRWIFWGQGLAFLISGSVILFFLKDMPTIADIKHAQAMQKTSEPLPVYHASSVKNGSFIKAFLKDHVLVIFLLAIVLVQYSHAQISYLMPLQLSSLFGLEASAKWNSYMWFTNGVCCIVLTPILLNLTKRFSQVVNVAIAAITYVIGMGGFYFLRSEQNLWIILVFTVVWTAGEVLVSTGTGVFIADRAAPQYRASYQSLYSLSSDFGRCLGPLTMGYILLVCNYAQGWIVTAAVSLVAVVILLFCYRMYRKEQVTK